MSATPIPKNHHSISPYLTIRNAPVAIKFYETVFNAVVTSRLMMPDGRVGHVEMRIGDSIIMLSDEFPEMGMKGPQTIGGTPVSIHLYSPDIEDIFKRAAAAGATIAEPPEDRFYGDRNGRIVDPFGHSWWVSKHLEDLTDEEVSSRASKQFAAKDQK